MDDKASLAIHAQGLTKTFERKRERGLAGLFTRKPQGPPVTAVDDVDLAVKQGELFGLLGPNGAGKTTLVKLLSTLLLPTGGHASVAGYDVATQSHEVRKRVGVVLGGERALYWRLTARENLWYFSQLYNIEPALARARIDDLLGYVGLLGRADERVENYSKGMKQRLHIARGLLNDPEVLLLDEPSIGLDPQAARDMRDLVRRLVTEKGRTVILTTHYLFEADALSDRVAIMNRGRIIALDTPGELKRRHAGERAYRVEAFDAPADFHRRLQDVAGVATAARAGEDPARGVAHFRVVAAQSAGGDEALPARLAQAAHEWKVRLVGLTEEAPTLEDVFVKLTGEALSAEGAGP